MRVFRNLGLHWSLCPALNKRYAVANAVSNNEIRNLQADEVTATQFAFDCKVEQSQIPQIAREFEPRADGLNLLWAQWPFRANQSPLVPWYTLRFDGVELDFGYQFSSIRPSYS